MFNLHCTQKLRDRLKARAVEPVQTSHWLASWYATTLPWRPQMAMLVNVQTLLPVIVPLAPSATLVQRLPFEIIRMLQAMGISHDPWETELLGWRSSAICKTANRSLLGTMNEFCFLAQVYRDHKDLHDPLSISMTLAGTPCGGAQGYRYPKDLVRQLILNGGREHIASVTGPQWSEGDPVMCQPLAG